MSLIYFKLDRATSQQQACNITVDASYKLRICCPRITSMHNLLWRLLSAISWKNPHFVEYQYLHAGEVVAYAQVIHKLCIFKFMDRQGIHVEPCYTKPAYRGQNLYPSLLQRIAADYPDREIYIFTSDVNRASVRGIVKAGFVPFAVGRKRLHCYVVEKYL